MNNLIEIPIYVGGIVSLLLSLYTVYLYFIEAPWYDKEYYMDWLFSATLFTVLYCALYYLAR